MADKGSNILLKKLYPLIATSLEKNESKFLGNLGDFINSRHELMFDIAPYDRIYHGQAEIDSMFKSLGILEKDVDNIMKECFFYGKPYNPQCAREPYVMTLMMAIRYFLIKAKRKNAELCGIYLAFSGKFYCSIHAGAAFPKAPPSKNKAIMDYVVNNMLTDKFDLKKEGTVFGAVASIVKTWMEKYEPSFVKETVQLNNAFCKDDEYGKLVQQLHDRERSFLVNIAKLFYEAKEKQLYLNYETDSLDMDDFRLTNNDASTAARITENTMNYLVSNHVSLEICNCCKADIVSAIEIKDIIEAILSDNNNLDDVRKVVNIIICDYMRANPGKPIGGIDFFAYSTKMKPNTKDKYLIEMKQIILSWLDENSPNYRRRKSRAATQVAYYKSVLMYFVYVINRVAKK